MGIGQTSTIAAVQASSVTRDHHRLQPGGPNHFQMPEDGDCWTPKVGSSPGPPPFIMAYFCDGVLPAAKSSASVAAAAQGISPSSAHVSLQADVWEVCCAALPRAAAQPSTAAAVPAAGVLRIASCRTAGTRQSLTSPGQSPLRCKAQHDVVLSIKYMYMLPRELDVEILYCAVMLMQDSQSYAARAW